jgi:hypothetical protein
MGLGTILNGQVRCDNCGAYIKSADISRKIGPGAAGLDLLTRIGSSGRKHFCSDRCKREWNAAHGKDGGADDNDAGGGGESVAAIKAQEKAAKAAHERQMFDEVLTAETAKGDAEEKERKEEFSRTSALKFGATAEEIGEALSDLFSSYSKIPSGIMSSDEKQHWKAMKAVILEKIEFGLLKLSKLDADTAEFFQKKLDDLKNPKATGLSGLFKKKS